MMVIEGQVKPGRHGLGLFTQEDLRAGQLVMDADDRLLRVVTLAEIATYPVAMQAFFHRYGYPGMGVHAMTEALYYNLDDTRFINHADHPNLRYVPEDETYVAAVDIPAGTELTCDYADFCPRGQYGFNF
jgi:uncharacterized protein